MWENKEMKDNMNVLRILQTAVVYRYIAVFLTIIGSFTRSTAQTQTNPYRRGTPHYWMAQGTINIYVGKFDVAYRDLQKAQKGYYKIGDVTYQIRALEAMGALKSKLGEWTLANQHYQEALQIAKDSHNETAQSMIFVDLLGFYKATGNVKDYSHCLESLDSLYNTTTSPHVKNIYHIYWSQEYLTQKEYMMADYHLQQCWNTMEELPIMDREQAKLSYYNNMMSLKKHQKDFNNAIEYAKKYVEQTKIINGNNGDQVYQANSFLALLYTENKDSISAFACLDKIEHGVGHAYQDNSMMATYYNLKGSCYTYFKNYDKAIECFDKAYQLLADKPTDDTPAKYSCLQSKAEACFLMKRFDDAYNTYLECMQAYKRKYGETSGNYYQTLFTLANIEAERGHACEADSLFCMSMNYLLSNMKAIWKYSTPSMRENLWQESLNSLSGMASFAIKFGVKNSELTRTCYDALLFSKALLLETEKSVLDILRDEGTENDVENYRNLLALNNLLAQLKRNYAYNRKAIDCLTIQQRKLEQQLTDKCQLYSEYNAFLDIDYYKVKNELKDNEILIDFSDFQTEDSLHRYTAYIVDRRQNHPMLVRCFDQSQLDSLLNGAANFMLYDYEYLKDKATTLLWKPLRQFVPENSTVYYVPSGVIHEIAIESLPLADGSILGQHYKFVRLSSARELLRQRNTEPISKTATLYGGLQYNVSSQILAEESSVYEKSKLAWITRSEYGTNGFKDLRKTKDEIEKIERTLAHNGYSVKKYSGVKGNAESFIAMSGKSPSILHIATHGFYYTPNEAKKNDFLSGYTDAMSLSGLVFAGGNAAWQGRQVPDGVLGGVLTARDIANLNFKGTTLAMLCACQTAKGKVTAEGLYGLQRAFKKAGVETLIVTLWKVRDSVAEAFATTFYQELFAQGGNKRSAFETTKNVIRKRYKDPFDWSCFIMVD